jgi:phage RecT family recombinase
MANEQKQLGAALEAKDNNKVALKEDKSLRVLINNMVGEYEKALMGKKELAMHFARVLQTMVNSNPKLLTCVPNTLLGASMTIAQLGLHPELQEAWIIPRWNKKIQANEAHYQLGIRGAERLFYQATPEAIIEAREVLSIDEFRVCYGDNPKLIHVPFANEGKVEGEIYSTFYYAVVRYKNGMSSFYVMTRQAVENHRDTRGAGGSAWETDFGEMGMNTVTKKLLKRLPKSIELTYALRDDNQIRRIRDPKEIDSTYSILDEPPEPENVADPNEVAEKVAPAKQTAVKPKEKVNPVTGEVKTVKAEPVEPKSETVKPKAEEAVIMPENNLAEIQKGINDSYVRLRKLAPKAWTDEICIGRNQLMLDGESNSKKCTNADLLLDLYKNLQNEILNFEAENKAASASDDDPNWADNLTEEKPKNGGKIL